MGRPLREEEAGALYHVIARGNNRERLFLDDADYRRYLTLLGTAIRRQRWHCMSYCLMPNHIHLLLETPIPNLAQGMHWIQTAYARTFNKRHRRGGHAFYDRYKPIRIQTDRQLFSLVGYIAANPVAAGLCRAPEDWPWSSHARTVTAQYPGWLDVERLLSHFSPLEHRQLAGYLEVVSARVAELGPIAA
jgi:putative transposase